MSQYDTARYERARAERTRNGKTRGEGTAAQAARWMELVTRLFIAIALVAGLIGALIWLAQRPLFDIRHIEVRGTLRHVDTAEMRAVILGPSTRPAGNFFTLRLDDARRAFEAVPWVAHASVRRGWPNRLIVTLTEHRAIGVWGDGRLLSDAGRLFAANPGEAEVEGQLVNFDGPPSFAAEAASRYYELATKLAPLALAISALEVSERASWSFATGSGQRFELGRDDPPGQVEQRVTQLLAAYPLVVARLGAPPRRIDLRYPNGFAAAGATVAGSERKRKQ